MFVYGSLFFIVAFSNICVHLWCDRDFDAFDLRMRLPAVVSILHKAINSNGGVTYIHCTAGLGRAPAVAVIRGGKCGFKVSCFFLYDGAALSCLIWNCGVSLVSSAKTDILLKLVWDFFFLCWNFFLMPSLHLVIVLQPFWP